MIRETIQTINERITAQLRTEAVQVAGLSVPFHDQQENAVSLKLADSESRFSLDSKMLWQSTHLLDGYAVAGSKTWGSFTDNSYDVRFVLIGLSKSMVGLNVAMRAADDVSYVVIDAVENDTLTVLNRYFRVKSDQNKNYDPALQAFAIRYRLIGVQDEDLAEIPSDVDLSALPLYFMNLETEPNDSMNEADIPNLLLNYNIAKL